MMKHLNTLPRSVKLMMSFITTVLMLVGCSMFEPPTASSDAEQSNGNLWNPQLGDEIESGRQIPIILDENYWDTPGPSINPFRGLNFATPVPIDGILGGTVTCGNHNFVVPAGAIVGVINFTMVLASGSGIAVDCGPSPLDFVDGIPVRITMSYAGTQYDPDYCERRGIEPLDASLLQIYYMAPDGSLERQDASRIYDAGAKTISVEVDHFSRYIVA